MKIGQAIDEIVNNCNKEFRNEELIMYWDYYSKQITIKNREKKGELFKTLLTKDHIDRDWELIQKPVTFMEVGKSKNIRIEHDLLLDCDKLTFRDTREMLSYLVKTFINSGVVEILTKGKFYIKEDN